MRRGGEDWVEFDTIRRQCDPLAVPNTPDEAPAGFDGTSDSIMARIWTLLRTPWIANPVTRGPKKFPAGDQIIAMIVEDTEQHVTAFTRDRF